MEQTNNFPNFLLFQSRRPQAWARLRGGEAYPDIRGNVRFYQTPHGVIVVAEVSGLPRGSHACDNPIFAFHLHEGDACTSTGEAFSGAGGHYNPDGCAHPYHAGDFPPLLGASGVAYSAFLTDRFRLAEIIGKTVILHAMRDDFTSQPSGGAGARIACGVVKR